MCMINEMNARVKELETHIAELEIACSGQPAKINGLRQQLSAAERDKLALNDQAKTLHLVANLLGTAAGEDVIKAVPLAVRQLLAERERLLDGVTAERDHITHAARCQLIREIEELFRAGEPMTAEQVIDLLSVEKEVAA